MAKRIRLGVGLTAVLACAFTALVGAPGASAGLLSSLVAPCDGQKLEQPFVRQLDPLSYVMVPGGNFEGRLSGWTLAGGAKVVSGNEPFYVGSSRDSHSLSLPAGASATTPPVCVGTLDPTLRFFANGRLLSTLKVEALFDGPLGIKAVPVVPVAGVSTWALTLPLPFLANAGALVNGGETAVAFRFTSTKLLGSTWRIDDIYVDPYRWY